MKIKLFTRKLNLQPILTIAVLLVLTGFDNFVWGQTTQTFTSNGSFTVPAGVTSIQIECWGAGGGGSNRGGASGGGGGGAYTLGIFSGLAGGNSISITVGNGGAIGTPTAIPGNSSSATFGPNTITANGGLSVNNSRNGGNGGSATTVGGIIIASYAGGDGGNARAYVNGGFNEGGGGGGGSATTISIGTNGGDATATGGIGGTGTGAGGRGADGDGNPDAIIGSAPGGGGGGRGEGGSTSKPGANGVVIISWTTVSAISTETCIGGSTGTITATGNGGSLPYTYSLNGAAYQASGTFSGLAAATYTVNVKDNLGLTAFTTVTVNAPATSADDPNAAGTNSWVGHVYDGTNFSNYIGHYTESETFNESFGGNTNCFNVTSNSTTRSIYTETFSVKYRMNSTKKGLYVADLGSDDGSRLTVDGTLLYNNWNDQGFSNRFRVLMSLNGASSLVYDFYENGGGNQVVFQNLALVLSNTLNTNTTQTICQGSTGAAISGDVFGALPAGISLSGTGYQWSYSTTPTGPRTNISGATGATYSPNATIAPFNVPGSYYIFRNAILSSSNNVSPNPYIATNESNPATLIVNPLSVTPTSISGITTVCPGSPTTLTAEGGLMAYYPFTTDVNDYSGNGLNLSGSGGSFSGDGLQLSNTSSYTSVSTPILNTDIYTISFDIKYTSANDGNWRKIFGYTPIGTDRSPGIWRYPDAMKLHWRHDPGNTGLTESFNYTLNQWYHIVGEKNGSIFTLYVDGIQVDQGTVANPKTAGVAALWFGGANIALKEFKIHNINIRWYTGSCGGTLIGSGPSITVSPVANTTYYVRAESACNTSTCISTTVNITPSVATPVFTLGATSSRSQGSGTVLYSATATNSTGITYSLDAASLAGGNGISSTTGNVTFVSTWTGSSTITATAAGCSGPTSSTHIVTTTLGATYYSYQTGNWNLTSTWTFDPSGTTQVGSSVPGNSDIVVILAGRTVTIPANISSTGLDISIEAGGFLDLSTFQFTAGLKQLSGQGTLAISSGMFPTPITTNTFINAGGGTTEYRTSINLPSQAIYNNLTINGSGITVTQTIDLTLNGNLHVKNGTFRINDNTARRLKLTISGDVTVDAGANLSVGTGVTNSTTNPYGITGGTAPFINYYDQQSHRIVLSGNFTNNGTVRFTNLAYPVFNAFPPTTSGATTGFATVYFQGASDNKLLCAGTTDFYNLVLDKGIDQTFKLTIYTSGSSYSNFRLFGANIAGGDGGGANPNLKKALWIRTGSLVLEGLTMIPSLTEGNGSEGGANPNSDFYIPANGAFILNAADVVVLSTADDYREVNLAYNTTAPSNAAMGITAGGTGCALSLYGKLQLNNGYLSTRESGGIITSSIVAGQFIMNNGTVDAKQFLGSTGAASFEQNGGLLLLRGRFQRTPIAYSSVTNLTDITTATLNTARSTSGINSAFGSFNLENTTNIFTMSGGTMRIYDVCDATAQKAFDIKSSAANINVTGGTLEISPLTGTVQADAANYLINSTAALGNLTINRVNSASGVQLSTNALFVQSNLILTAGTFNANNLNVTIGGNFTVENGTTYTPGTNTTILNGTGSQTFTVNLATPLSLNKFTIDKTTGSIINFAGSQKTINVNDNFRLVLGTLNDNGNTIYVYKDVYNSGLQSGAGKIAFVGTVAQQIDGNGVFNNVELNNNTAVSAPISLAANMTINGMLTFSRDKLLNIGTYNLLLNSSASIVNGGSLRYIQTAGNSGDGGLTKIYASTTAFIFPIGGTSTRHATTPVYSPATIGFTSAPTTYGTVTVIPVGYEHPASTVNGQSLTYFWRVKSSGFTGIAANSVTHTFVYDQSDVVGTEINYIPSVYNQTTYTWNNGVAANIDKVTNTITDWTTPANSKAFLDGDYTAGDAAFGTPKVYYSLASGLWNSYSTWTFSNTHAGAQAGSIPSANDIVVIGDNDIVTLTTSNTIANTGSVSCASLQIDAGSVLDIGNNPSSIFGMVLNNPSGNNGLFRVTTTKTTSWKIPKIFEFPSGDFSDFNANHGTTEFYDIDGTLGALYILPANVTSYGNLMVTAKGGDNLILPNNSLTTIQGDLTCGGDNAGAWICMSWSTAHNGFTQDNYGPIIEKTVHITGNMYVNTGTFLFMDEYLPQHLIVEGNIVVAANGYIDVNIADGNSPGSPPVANTLSIGGNLTNNSSATPYVRFLSGTYYCNVTFKGSNNSFLTGTSASTIFNKVTINKGTSQSTSLTCNIGGALVTPVDNWLTLQNGTFKYMRNVNSDFTVSTITPFTIPATAAFHSEYTTANKILIANSASNTNDIYLNGKLKVVSGNVFIGPINGTTSNNNDIEYSGGGTSEIEVTGGTLVVNGQIRQNPSSTAGVLKYRQGGGVVTINGNAANTTNAKLELMNSGSEFTMSAGSLNIMRGGGGNAYGDLYLRPGTGSVTGGDINFINNLSGSNQQYLMDATFPLNNLTITGRTAATAATATVKLMINPLILNGNLTLANAQSILDVNPVYNLPVTIKGNFTNYGAYNHYNNLTTFSGGTQSLLGTMPSTPTDFYNLNVSPVTKLTLSKDITVTHDLSMGNGTLECTTFTVNAKGDVANNATYTNSNTNSGMILNGSSIQRLSGTGTFGQLELYNAAGAIADNNITLNKDLVLTAGILDINTFLLTLGQNSNIQGAPFSATKMITSDGVWSNIGIEKVFGSPLTTTFTYPLGTPGKYTPAVLTITNNGQVGSIRVNNINSKHPSVLDPANVLKYYWEVESTGISGFSGNLLLYYNTSDVVGGPENTYIAAQLLTPGTNWSKAATGPATDNVNETNHTITFNYNNSSNLTGEYTAGNDAAIPTIVPQYTSNSDGNWTDNTIWTPSGGTTYPCPVGGPNGFIVTINHEVTANANYCFAYKTTINNKLKAVSPYYGHNFGSVYGNGTLYLESFVFPAGRYGAFIDCAGNSTIEFGGTGFYDINATLYSSAPRVLLSGTGTRVLPDKDLTICKQLKIDDGNLGLLTLDNSINNRKLTINGTFERYNNGIFKSGTGSPAVVEFAGSLSQTIGGVLGDFTGINAFNNFEINNSAGLSVNDNGNVEVNGDLLLTNGLISTTSTNKLIINNFSVSCVIPNGGSAASYIDGPLIKKLNQGDPSFKFPVGKSGYGLGNKLSLRATKTGTLYWVVEYFSPNPYPTYLAPLTAINTKEYWNVSGVPATSQAYIELAWDNTSDLIPLMTQNGISDMSVAEHDGTDWIKIAASPTTGSDNYNGSVETISRTGIITGSRNYTLSCENILKPRIRLAPTGPICGAAGIPVTLTSSFTTYAPYSISYTKDGVAQAPLTPASFPTTLPTAVSGGVYKITGFTYNYPAGTPQTGVFDVTPVTVYPLPTTAAAGPDQSLCGATAATLAANTPTSGTGLWSIVSGAGGTLVSPNSPTGVFTGTNGSTYILRWTISNGTCISSDNVTISFPLLPVQPLAFTTSSTSVCLGQTGVVYTVPNDASVTYTWSYSGSGATINGTGNSVTVDFNNTATNGTLGVTATNGCGISAARTVSITINPQPTATIAGTTTVCQNSAAPLITFTNPRSLPITVTYNINGANQATINVGASSSATVAASTATSGVNVYNLVSVIYQIAPLNSVTLSGTATVTIIGDLTWNGSISTDWNLAANWSCGFIPDQTNNVQIPNVANKPILSSGPVGKVKNIVINNSSSLTVTGNTLQIAGTITNNGTFNAVAGTIEMIGSVAQSIGSGVFSGNSINGLTINNTAGVTLLGPLEVTGIVNAQSGSLTSGGNLTLVSTAAQTALIDGTGTGTITGNVTMQRYLPSGYGYKYLSSPFQAATVNELADDVDLVASFPTLYQYDEDNHRDSSAIAIYTTGWSKYNTASNLLTPMKGYAANSGNSPIAKTIDITGVVNNNIGTTLTLYNHDRLYTKGFNLIGNPYPSPIDWNVTNGWTKTNVDNALYYFDAGIIDEYTGTYSTYINGVSSNGTAGSIIASMQGFFIHVSDGSYPVSATLGMDNRVRINNLSPAFHKSAYVQTQPLVRITAAYENAKMADPTVVYFEDFASNEFDQQLDALKLMNTDISVPNLYTLTPKPDKLSISAIPFPTDSITKAPLGLKTEQDNFVTFTAKDIIDMPTGLNVYLSDVATGKIQDLQVNPQYRVQLAKGTFENRFVILFSDRELMGTFIDNNTFFANIANGKLNVFVKLASGNESRLVISNMLGQIMLQKNLIGNGLHEIDPYFPAAMYILTLYSQQGICSHKIYIPK